MSVEILATRRNTAVAPGPNGELMGLSTDGLGCLWTSSPTQNTTNGVTYTSDKFYNSAVGKPTIVSNFSFQTATISAVPCLLVGARIVNTTGSVRYLFANNALAIAGGAAPTTAPIMIPASGAYHLPPEELGRLGDVFTTALTIGNSSTAATFTAATAGDLLVTVYWTTSTN